MVAIAMPTSKSAALETEVTTISMSLDWLVASISIVVPSVVSVSDELVECVVPTTTPSTFNWIVQVPADRT